MTPTSPQQPIEVATPKRAAAAAFNPASPDETKSRPTPSDAPSRRSSSQQPIDLATPNLAPAAASLVPEQQSQCLGDTHSTSALLLWDPVLQITAASLDDIESARKAQGNRCRVLTAGGPDEQEARIILGIDKPPKEGAEPKPFKPGDGFALLLAEKPVVAAFAQFQTLQFLNAAMTKALQKQLRHHPLHPWIKAQNGLGDKTVARLFGALRDPYWNDLHDRPRTVSELFAFCGVAGPGYKRTRGQKVNWNPEARMRLWVIADRIVLGKGPYRAVYDAARAQYAEKLHTATCAQCGGKGTPAEPGTPWRPGHQSAGAKRLVMREILRDLWEQGRAYYEQQPSRSATPISLSAAASTGGGGLPGVPATTTTKEPA